MCWEPGNSLNHINVQRVLSSQNNILYQSNLPTSNSTPSVIDLEDHKKDIILIDYSSEAIQDHLDQLVPSTLQQFTDLNSEKLFTINEYFIEDLHGEFIKQQIINFDLPCKRPSESLLSESQLKHRETSENQLKDSISQNFLQLVTIQGARQPTDSLRRPLQNTRS
jgi:hypothetical protein